MGLLFYLPCFALRVEERGDHPVNGEIEVSQEHREHREHTDEMDEMDEMGEMGYRGHTGEMVKMEYREH